MLQTGVVTGIGAGAWFLLQAKTVNSDNRVNLFIEL